MMALDRVVIVNDRAEAKGGASGLALLSARLLAARGVPVTYVTGDAGSPGLDGIAQVVALGSAGLTERGAASALTTGIYNPAAARLMREVVARDTPGTVYHVHGWSKILSPAVLGPLAPVAARTLLHAHDYFLACPNGAFMNYRTGSPCPLKPMSAACLATNCDKRSYKQKIWRVSRQAMLERTFDVRRLPSDILLIHPAMAEPFLRYGVPRSRLVTLRNPVEPLTAEPVAAAANRSAFFVGRIEEEKGVEDFLAAARLSGTPVEIVGDGPERGRLAEFYPEATFHGWKQRAEVGALIRHARVVVMPSRYPEPFGLVAAEAAASGVPVLVSDTAAIAGDVAAAGLGLSFRANDPASCAEALARCADDALVAAMSARAATHGHTLATTPETWCDGLLAAYHGAVNLHAAAA